MTTMAIPVPDFGGLFLLIGIFLIMLCLAFLIWRVDHKKRYLTDYKTIVDDHDSAVRTAAYRLIIYLASLPLIVLLYIGAAKLVEVKPTWNLSLTLTLIFVNLIYTIWIVALPLWNLCVTTVYMWAAEINVYMQKEYPLEYYEPKPGHLKLKK